MKWCGLSAKRSDRNATITGYGDQTIPLIDNIQEAVNFGFEGMGIMHSSVDLIGDAIELVKTKHDDLIMAYPDSGYFKSPNWQFEEIITPNHLTEFANQWKQAGANIIGGCCGLGPEHTEALYSLKWTISPTRASPNLFNLPGTAIDIYWACSGDEFVPEFQYE